MTIDPVLSWAFAGVGAFAQGMALLLMRRPIRLLRAGGSAVGKVEDNEEEMISSGRGPARLFHFPVITFATPQGERIKFRSSTGGGQPLAKGSDVRVIFDPANPSGAELASFRNLWLFPMVTALFGLPFLAVGIAGLL
jgi:hypothetical protein